MEAREMGLEQLLNHRVHGLDGRTVGHLEELVIERDADGWHVAEYRVGAFALLTRLGGWPLGRAMLRSVGLGKGRGYRVPWQMLDLSDASRLRLRCDVSELRHVEK
jgi:sporulation protein YlmC with PRC-barrel domain